MGRLATKIAIVTGCG